MRNRDVETMWAAFRALTAGTEPPKRFFEFLTIIEPKLAAAPSAGFSR